jgi:hypothetical protein
VVNELKPECALFVSKGMYDQASQEFPSSTPLAINDEVALRIYKPAHSTTQIHQALASWIYHPSSRRGGFRRPRPVVKALTQVSGGAIR